VSQVFPRYANEIPKGLAVVLGLVFVSVVCGVTYYFTPKFWEVGYAPDQPVDYSHQIHVGKLGMDCRYCHNTVEESAFASVPPTQTCMNCHSQIWALSPTLEPVRASWASGESIEWTKVYDLPDYVYFNHSIHIAKGVGCVSCHGRVDQMNLIYQTPTLFMSWCLDCHRNPAPNLRPRSEVFNMAWQPPADNPNLGAELMAAHDVHGREDCTACHR